MLGRLAVFAVLAGSLVVAAPAAAASKQKVRSYRVTEVRDLLDRSALTVAGAAIVEVDHAEAVVTANRRAVRRMRRAGYRVTKLAPPRRARRARRRLPAPPTATYHNYAEMQAEVQSTAAAFPAHRVRASRSGGRTRAASCGRSRSPTTSPPTSPSPRCCSPPTSTHAST